MFMRDEFYKLPIDSGIEAVELNNNVYIYTAVNTLTKTRSTTYSRIIDNPSPSAMSACHDGTRELL
jgi:hypothetical protein